MSTSSENNLSVELNPVDLAALPINSLRVLAKKLSLNGGGKKQDLLVKILTRASLLPKQQNDDKNEGGGEEENDDNDDDEDNDGEDIWNDVVSPIRGDKKASSAFSPLPAAVIVEKAKEEEEDEQLLDQEVERIVQSTIEFVILEFNNTIEHIEEKNEAIICQDDIDISCDSLKQTFLSLQVERLPIFFFSSFRSSIHSSLSYHLQIL